MHTPVNIVKPTLCLPRVPLGGHNRHRLAGNFFTPTIIAEIDEKFLRLPAAQLKQSAFTLIRFRYDKWRIYQF
jgi:hypothetical protein